MKSRLNQRNKNNRPGYVLTCIQKHFKGCHPGIKSWCLQQPYAQPLVSDMEDPLHRIILYCKPYYSIKIQAKSKANPWLGFIYPILMIII